MPRRRATASAVTRLSPVSMTIRRPSARSALSASAAISLIGSATPTSPAARPSIATNIDSLAVASQFFGPRAELAGIDTVLAEQRRHCQSARCDRRRGRSRPCPRASGTRRRPENLSPRAAAPATIAAASGCSLARSTDAASRSNSRLVDRRERDRGGQRAACPSVSVPVLSTTSVSTFSSRSSASAFAHQHAGARAAPGADHDRHRRRQPQRAGAGDDQHGDCVDERVRERAAAGPATRQATKVSDRDKTTTAGTK